MHTSGRVEILYFGFLLCSIVLPNCRAFNFAYQRLGSAPSRAYVSGVMIISSLTDPRIG